MANVGAALCLLAGPTGCDPAFCVIWFPFRFLHRYLSLCTTEVAGVYRLLEMVSEGCLGHCPVHLLSASAAEVGFRWGPLAFAWSRPDLPLHCDLAGPVQHFRAAVLDAWRDKVTADLCGRTGFRGGPLLDFHGSMQLLDSYHVRVVSGMVFSLRGLGGILLPVDSVVLLMVICFGNVPFLLLLRFVRVLSFMISRGRIRFIGQGACSGMVGFLCFLELIGLPLGC